MTPHTHFSDEQLDALLHDGSAPPVDVCPSCETELRDLRASLADFRTATTALAAATPLPPFKRPIVVTGARRLTMPRLAFSAATALLIVGSSISILRSHPTTATGQPAPAAVQTASPNVSDEALLEDVSRDLSASVPTSLEPLDLTTTTSPK